jgi:hypothetical protein
MVQCDALPFMSSLAYLFFGSVDSYTNKFIPRNQTIRSLSIFIEAKLYLNCYEWLGDKYTKNTKVTRMATYAAQ